MYERYENMKLSSLFTQGNQVHTENTTVDASKLEQNLKNGMEQISGKMPGETVAGTIVEKNGNDVLVAIGKNQMLQARLEGSVQVDVGQQLTFSIKNALGNKVILSPLFTNMANDPNVSKALQMAGIPENEISAQIVRTMMQEGMPVDKNSLQQMMRTAFLNPQTNIETLVQLTRLQIPVTDESIFQLEAYKNYEHQLTEGVLTIADSMPETLQAMAADGRLADGISLYKEIIFLLNEHNMVTAEKGTNEILQQNGLETVPGEGTTTETVSGMVRGGQRNIAEINEAEIRNAISGEELPSNLDLSKAESAVLADKLKQAGFTKLGDAVLNNQISKAMLFDELSRLLSMENFPSKAMECVGKFLESSEFNKLLKQEMKNQWMIAPEEVAKNHKVEDFYERLNDHMNRLRGVVEQAASQSPLAKAVTAMTGNLDFMNQLNQLFTYVQLPFKLQGQEANGELYVYTNKRNLAQKDGEVSALLHLDMEHLGSVDVHVSMKDSRVATQFYLKDDSALDLIYENIGILNDRLEKRGYQLNASFIHKESEQNVIAEILEQDKNISVLSGRSFDARA